MISMVSRDTYRAIYLFRYTEVGGVSTGVGRVVF